jgi:activator of 2-hydroxyglutaryl-CoA dehydratase
VAKQVNTSNEVKATPFNPAKYSKFANDAPQPFVYDTSMDQLRQQNHVSRSRHGSKQLITVSSGSQQQSAFMAKEESPVILSQSVQSEFRIQSPEKYKTKQKQQPAEFNPSRTNS